ncbi:MAG: TonB-dependent receptor [Rhodanobacter sp.]|nr:MAG: TonB-dependent receptor [Rhodanobacter sp.]
MRKAGHRQPVLESLRAMRAAEFRSPIGRFLIGPTVPVCAHVWGGTGAPHHNIARYMARTPNLGNDLMTSFHASRIRKCLLAASVAQALIAIPALAQTTSGTQSASEKHHADASKPVKLEAVMVTAQRRSQNLQEVPIAVTALDEAQLSARGIQNVSDMGAVAPNLTVMNAPGNASSSAISIRGAININPAPYWDQPVGMYVDGVYLGKTQGNVFDLLNLERIEVLRGPQGTLFGRNTMAGAVNLVTRAPSGVFTGDASVGIGNYGSKVSKVTMDLPAMGKLKVSLGGRVERRDGWVKTTPGSAQSQLANRRNNEAFVGLEYDATDNLTFNYRYDYTNLNQGGLFNQTIHSDVEQAFGIPGIIVNQSRQTRASIDSPDFEKSRVSGNALTVTWKLGDAGTLKYIGAYRKMDWADALDLDGSPILFAQTANQTRYHQTSHELQYLGSYGPWNWVAGAYYFSDSGFSNNPQTYFLGQADYDENFGYGTRSRALYAQVDYKLTDKLTLTAGLRRTIERKNASRYEALVNPDVVIVPQGTAAQAGFSATTPALNLAYQLSPNHMVYARYAEGYLAGGFNGEAQTVATATTPFKPETQKTYELGTKNTLLDGKLSLDADVFHNRVSNLQQSVFTAQGSASSTVLNVGTSHQQGFELEAHLRPTEDLTLGLNYGYLHAKYDKFMVTGVNVANNRSVQFAPKNTASVVVDSVLARTSNGVLHATLDYRYTSKFYMYVYPFTQTVPAQQLAQNTLIKADSILNGRIALSDMNWGPVSGEVAFWVKNLTNKSHIDSIIDFGPNFGNLRTANYNEPRTFGVTITARW